MTRRSIIIALFCYATVYFLGSWVLFPEKKKNIIFESDKYCRKYNLIIKWYKTL